MTNKIKNTIGIKTVILAGLIASFPYNVAGQHFYMERNIEELLYSCLCSEGIIDYVPQSGNTLLVYSDGITKVNMAHIEIFDLMTGEMGCRRAMKEINGIFGFYIIGQFPRQIYVFLKYGDEYTVLKPTKYGENNIETVKKQIALIFDHFDRNIRLRLDYEYLLPEYIDAVCGVFLYNSMHFKDFNTQGP